MTVAFVVMMYLQILFIGNRGRQVLETPQQCEPCVCYNRTADCSNCKLSKVPDRLPLDTLLLDMKGNSLKSIGPGCFERYRHLTHLILTDNQLDLLPGVYDFKSFAGLRNLTMLETGGNSNSVLNTSLQYSYPDDALSKLTSLEELFIDGVPSAVLGDGFLKLGNLRKITFGRYCNLNYVQSNMFNNTPHLTFLNISNCYIYHIQKSAFKPLLAIKIIDISENYGLGFDNTTIATYGLQGSPIRVLYANKIVLPFSVNVIIKNNSFCYLHKTNIQELYLDHNAIELLEPGTLDIYPPSLKVLSLNDNRFTVGQYLYDAQKLKGLKRIYLSDMSISHHFIHARPMVSLQKDVGDVVWQGPPDLQYFTARNYLMGGKISEMNINMSSIKSVDISNNVLTKWIGPVKYFESLHYAIMSRCFGSEINEFFFLSFPKLVYLDISFNLIGDTLNRGDESTLIFRNLTNLQNLNLSTNRIRGLHPEIFKYNTHLQHLNLSNNEISNMSFKVQQLNQLTDLDLRRNQIRTLPRDTRLAMDTISHNLSIDLSENPLICTCDNIDFLIWLSKTKILKKNFEQYYCINANNERVNMNPTLISALESKCKSYFGYIIAGLSGIVLFLSVTVMGLVYRYRWKLKYLYHVARDRYRPQRRQGSEERYYEFDAFVSCSDEDLQFVQTLLAELEGKGRRLCVHHRDFRPGEPIASNIVRAVQRSRRTLLILSRHFLSSHWCRYEFEMAKMEAVHEERNVILVVKIGDIDSADMPRELMYMMKTDSYAEFPEKEEDQPAFWVTLNSAL